MGHVKSAERVNGEVTITVFPTTSDATAAASRVDLVVILPLGCNIRNLDMSANTGNASGVANSLDTGSWAYNTWYNTFLIYDGTTSGLLFSLSATAPLLPTGYTHFARVNAFRTPSAAAANYYPKAFTQRDGQTRYRVGATGSNVLNLPIMASGAAGNPSTPTWQALSVSSFVPPTATGICLLVSNDGSSANIIAAPSNNYGGYASTTNPPPINLTQGSSALRHSAAHMMILESTNIYYASNNSSSYIACIGWEE